MLDALRRGAQTWVAKILFAILIVSFGVFWNVADVFRGGAEQTVAEVGKTRISAGEFQRAFQNEMQAVSTKAGQRISTEQALLLGFDKQAVDRLVAQAAVKAHAKQLDLALSDAMLAEALRNDPEFAGPDGKFSRIGFDGLLQQMNLSEAGFFALRRDDEVRRQIIEALQGSVVAPRPFVEQKIAERDETRTLAHVKVDPFKVKPAEPDDSKLLDTYEKNKSRFVVPEYRKLGVLILSVDDLKGEVKLTDDEIKAAYEESKATYDKAERRNIQQIAFKDKAAAEAARKKLVDEKKNFFEVAKETGATEADVKLGMLAKSDLLDPAVADAVFKLERDQISEVIDGRFAYFVARVIEVDPGKESTFEESKEKVRDKVARQRAEASIQDRFDLVEEGRHAGKTLKEIGDEQKLRFIAVEAVDRENKKPDGATAVELQDAATVVKAAFDTSPGLDQDAVELAGGSYAWINLEAVTPEKQKPFEDVKADVKTVYTDLETQRLLDELVKGLVDRINNGEAIDKIATEAGNPVETTDPIKRVMSPPGLTTEAVKVAFTLPQGKAASAPTSDRKARVVFQVKEITPAPAPSQEQIDTMASQMRSEIENEVLLAYIAALRKDLGVAVNQSAIDRVTGAATSRQ